MKLMIIWGSSRESRQSGPLVEWVKSEVAKDGRFEIDFVDLKELNLPMFDEPADPLTMKSFDEYKHPEARAWAERVDKSEAFLFITPEYNRSIPAVLKNALDTAGRPWIDKPAGIISYGGASSGIIAASHLRLIVVELGLVQAAYWLAFNRYRNLFDESGQLRNPEYYEGNLKKILDELVRLHEKLKK